MVKGEMLGIFPIRKGEHRQQQPAILSSPFDDNILPMPFSLGQRRYLAAGYHGKGWMDAVLCVVEPGNLIPRVITVPTPRDEQTLNF
jgi:hypothetical protein